jgi:integrase
LVPGRAHLGWQCWKGEATGRWVLRRYVGGGKYRATTIGAADDAKPDDGQRVLSFEQAEAKARAMLDEPGGGKIQRITVRQAHALYVDYKRTLGRSAGDALSRGTAHILPALGDMVVAELTAEQLRRWLAALASAPAQTRPKSGKVQYRPAPQGDEETRKRRASANRVLTILKAMLNHAHDEGHVGSREAWGRKLKPFRDVEVARVRYLKVEEAQRLMNACAPDFRSLVRAGLETGARYGELIRMQVCDFDAAAGTVAVRRSKTGKSRQITLTDDGATFLAQHCAGRAGDESMFLTDDSKPWKRSEQTRPMKASCVRAKLRPQITFHGLRHTWASLAVMSGVPLMVVAKNLGHRDTRMVERHYGHLSDDYVRTEIREKAPRFGVKTTSGVVPLR